MRIALVTDAWMPQVNGVVRTLATTVERLRARGNIVETITPDLFGSVACPGYPEIRLALGAGRAVVRRLDAFAPTAVHIATEGPLGWAARRWCLKTGMPFTTSFHTRFPEYLAVRTGLPAAWFWPMLRRFHAPAGAILVATPRLAAELARHGLTNSRLWSRGVDLGLFDAARGPHPAMAALPRPVQLCVGRVAVEKNIEAFLSLDAPGSKVVVGDGPALAALRARFPAAHFLGAMAGATLASAYAAADVFVFTSRTDTFGLVMIEALASGVPVAAYPVQGPLDVIGDAPVGALREDLGEAISAALACLPNDCVAYAREFSWDRCTDQFTAALIEAGSRCAPPSAVGGLSLTPA